MSNCGCSMTSGSSGKPYGLDRGERSETHQRAEEGTVRAKSILLRIVRDVVSQSEASNRPLALLAMCVFSSCFACFGVRGFRSVEIRHHQSLRTPLVLARACFTQRLAGLGLLRMPLDNHADRLALFTASVAINFRVLVQMPDCDVFLHLTG